MKIAYRLTYFFLCLAIAAGVAYIGFQLDPEDGFYLCNYDSVRKCDEPYEGRIATNIDSYTEGDPIWVVLNYCSNKDRYVEFHFILEDGIRVDGINKTLNAYEFCGSSYWMAVLDVPIMAHASDYRIYGYYEYWENPFKRVKREIRTNNFRIEGGGDYTEFWGPVDLTQ